MRPVTLSWNDFVKEAQEFLEVSKRFRDEWEFVKKSDLNGYAFLCCKKSVQSKVIFDHADIDDESTDFIEEINDIAVAHSDTPTERLLMEYHVVYSISYQVPMLYLKVHRSDGGMLEMEQVWQLFGTTDVGDSMKPRNEMLTVLTQMEHPVLFKPFYAIHPCRTGSLLAQTPKSQNRILTFISLMGPYFHLNLDNRYGLEMASERERYHLED